MKIKYITFSEAQDILHKHLNEKTAREETIDDITVREYNYISSFTRLDADSAKKAVKEIMKIGDFQEELAVKIVDLMPKDLEQLRSILNTYKLAPDEKVLNNILEYIASI
jgi:DNA-directed RNA polymerase subunit F